MSTGFHHVVDPPPLDVFRLYRVTLSRLPSATTPGRYTNTLVVREVEPVAASLIAGDAYVLDKGAEVWQLNTKESAGQEKYKAAEFVQSLVDGRKGCEVVVFGTNPFFLSDPDYVLIRTHVDEGNPGVYKFLGEFGPYTVLLPQHAQAEARETKLFKLSDATGRVSFEQLPQVSQSLLSSEDAFLIDDSKDPVRPAVYVWIGSRASLQERRSIVQYAQQYLYQERESHLGRLGIPIIKMEQGNEGEGFLAAFE